MTSGESAVWTEYKIQNVTVGGSPAAAAAFWSECFWLRQQQLECKGVTTHRTLSCMNVQAPLLGLLAFIPACVCATCVFVVVCLCVQAWRHTYPPYVSETLEAWNACWWQGLHVCSTSVCVHACVSACTHLSIAASHSLMSCCTLTTPCCPPFPQTHIHTPLPPYTLDPYSPAALMSQTGLWCLLKSHWSDKTCECCRA